MKSINQEETAKKKNNQDLTPEQMNTKLINDVFKNFNKDNVSQYAKNNLDEYLSEANKITHYYGNLRIRYLGFTVNFIAFFISTITFYMTLVLSLNPILWFTGLLLIGVFFVYLGYFIRYITKRFNTITFKHSNLQHFHVFKKMTEYPDIHKDDLKNFLKLIDKNEGRYSIIDDIKALIKQYLYQINYNEVANKVREYLVSGFVWYIVSLIISLVLLGIFSVYLP